MNIDMGMDSIDTISFKIEQSEELECDILGIFINGIDIIQMIQQYEAQFESEIAGGYEGPLQFDREQYMSELQALKAKLQL